jgi:hypothetical protein
MDNKIIVKTDLENYYGEVFFIQDNDNFYMQLDDCFCEKGQNKIIISKELFEIAKDYFKENKNNE